MSDNRNDVGMWVGLGVVSAAMIWVVSKPRRILVAIAILGILAFWADREDKRATKVSADNRERKVQIEKLEAEWRLQADPIEWLQIAILKTQWENYLGTISGIQSSKYWTGEGIHRPQWGDKLSEFVTHSEIEGFVDTILLDTLSHPLFSLRDPVWDNYTLVLHEADALKVLWIKKDSHGMYHWDGRNYAYEGPSPALTAPSLSILPKGTEVESFVAISIQAREDYRKMKSEAIIRRFEEEDLESIISAKVKRVKRANPEIENADLKRIVLAQVKDSYKLRELLKECPNYQVERYPYFLNNE